MCNNKLLEHRKFFSPTTTCIGIWTYIKYEHLYVFFSVVLGLEYLYIIRHLPLKYRLIYLRVLKVFAEPSGESNTER